MPGNFGPPPVQQTDWAAGQTVASTSRPGQAFFNSLGGGQGESSVSGNSVVSSRTAFRATARKRFRPATSWIDLFDWRFEKYLTPWIVRATWIICVLLAALWVTVILVGVIWALAPDLDTSSQERTPRFDVRGEARGPALPLWLTARVGSTLVGLMSVAAVGLALLWIRVVLESVIVLFNIATTLRSIDEKAGEQNSAS